MSAPELRPLPSQSKVSPEMDAAAETHRLKTLIPLIFTLLAIALTLKVWDERQTAEMASLLELRAEATALASRASAKAELTSLALRLAKAEGLGRSEIASIAPGVDVAVSITDARQSPDGSRLADAAVAARALSERGHVIALSRAGDFVYLPAGQAGPPLIALAPIDKVLPAPGPTAGIALFSGEVSSGLGAPSLIEAASAAPADRPAIAYGPGLSRTATACVPIERSEIVLCAVSRLPLITIADLVRLLILLLLIAAPAFTLFGLVRRLSIRQTEMIIQETRNEEADRILGLVMRGARAGYWEWSQVSNSIFLSDGAASLVCIERPGLITLEELLEQVPPEAHASVHEAFSKARAIGWIHITFPVMSQPLRWVELRGSVSDDPITGGPVFGGIMLDVTERKQSEDRVRAAERRLRAAIEGFNGPFALWDSRRKLLYWNRSFALDFGLQDTLRAGMGHDTVAIARAGSVLLERQSTEDARTTLIALRSGRWIKMVERQTPDGGLITVGVDVTENVRTEEELTRQKERMKKAALDLQRSEGRANELSRKYSEEKSKAEHAAYTKSAFLANMSHELRTPLNAIIGFSEVMLNELAGPLGDPSYKEYARDILTSGQHLLDMINDILDMAKIEAGKMTISTQPIDPIDPVDAALRMVRRKAEEKEIELVLEAQPRLPDIDADHRAIRQMMLNLLSNAIKFTPKGGRIVVTIEQRGPEIYFGVTDTGIGIPAEDLPRLAQPFEQVSRGKDSAREGTGLGLALTKSFAEMHGGRLLLSSIYGEGTTVAFVLPIGGPSSAAQAETFARDVA